MTVIGLVLVDVLVLPTRHCYTRRRVSAAVSPSKVIYRQIEKIVEENISRRIAKELERPAPKGNAKG